jgi:hypothetical protein
MIDDDLPAPGTAVDVLTSADCLHYVPRDHEGVRQRVAKVAAWISSERPALMVVDVSVEIAMLCRLATVATVYVRLSGTRDDAAHLQAFRGARGVMAPFHADLEEPSAAQWVREKTRYFPGLTQAVTRGAPAINAILWVNGRGGGTLDGAALAAAAASLPQCTWRVIGPATPPLDCPPNLALLGWVDDAEREIANADVVIGSAGDGVVNAVIAAGRPYVCLPQARPYAEQFSKARRLDALGAAVVLNALPATADWPAVIGRARALDLGVLARLHDADGPRKACEYLCALADR